MIDWLKEIEQQILLAINGANSPFLDEVMWTISGKFIWFPMYLLLFYFVFRFYSLKHAIWFTVFGIAAVALCDSTATYLFKYNVARYRPSHHLVLGELLHYYEMKPGEFYKGGQYGFISSHAGNSTVIATMFILQLKDKLKFIKPALILWVALVCYSRMYLGVHYPTDILGGILWALGISFLMYYGYQKVTRKLGTPLRVN